jgi:PST family polysaccharide transporter
VVSRPLIQLALGTQWAGVVPIFAILATVSFVQPVITLWGMVLLSRGMGRRYLQLGIFNTLCSAVGFGLGLPWGAVGVATGYAIVTYVTAYPILVWAFRGTPIRFADFMQSIGRPFLAAITATTVCSLVGPFLAEWPSYAMIAAFLLLFFPLYLLAFFVLPGGRTELDSIWRLAAPFLARIPGLRLSTTNASGDSGILPR